SECAHKRVLGRSTSADMWACRGVLITCNMNERKCTAEAYDLLSEYAEQLYGPETVKDSHSEEDGDDVEAALKREVAQIRTSTEKRERRFQALESGANNVVFIRTQGLGECSQHSTRCTQ
uniref:Uncharacterized protein n=1 Tax=Denticeps clupeoides TaxID=299321 RepID=A0AAY4B735_9TELE